MTVDELTSIRGYRQHSDGCWAMGSAGVVSKLEDPSDLEPGAARQRFQTVKAENGAAALQDELDEVEAGSAEVPASSPEASPDALEDGDAAESDAL